MKQVILTLLTCGFALTPAVAQVSHAAGYNGNPYVGNPYVGNPYNTPFGNPYGRPYGNPYAGSPFGSNPLYNPAGGYVNPWVNPYGNPYMYNGMPINSFGMPTPIGGGFFGMASNGRNFNFWKAPSGYYYPWSAGYGQSYTAPIVVINNGATQPAQPPLSTIFSDTLKYLDDQKAAGKLSEGDFTHLKQRTLDLLSKERDLRTQASGSLDQEQETSIRNDVDTLGGEIARRVKP
jgi:hypothetical protein